MKTLIILLMSSLLLYSCASLPPRQEWQTTDKVAFGMACGANAYDFYTTKRVIDNGGYIASPWPELLYFGDETPKTEVLAFSKVVQLGVAWSILDRMPPKWRRLVLFLGTGTWIFYASKNEY